MGRFRCPSASFEEIGAAGQAATPSQDAEISSSKGKEREEPPPVPAQARAVRKSKDKGKGKAAVLPQNAVEEDIKDQARRKRKRAQARKQLKHLHQKYIFVGNLTPDITELQLEEIFTNFGTVVSVTMRSAGGYPRTFKPGTVPKGKLQYENRVYASVEFKHAAAVHRAMELDNTELNGQRIAIVRDALDLPAFQEIIGSYTKSVRDTEPLPSTASVTAQEREKTPDVVQPTASDSSSRIQPQPTNARVAHQFRSRVNESQHTPNTEPTKSTK
ncbi:hypothetical protein BC835DRAFT_1331135 [Cytidiella melzeri]|nr:hypothetical protein BC835DRAFT_1331135 [Cytidiella melzeri]